MPRRTSSASPERFTDSWLARFRKQPPHKEITLFERSTGLGVRVNADASVISFLIQLRLSDGRRWRETLRPPFPGLSVAQARAAAHARAGDIAVGVDPFEERAAAAAERQEKRDAEAAAKAKAEADAFTLRGLMRLWDRRLLAERRKSYAVNALRSIERTFPALIDRPVTDLARKEVRDALRKDVRAALDHAIEHRGKGAAITAGAALRTCFRWAAKHDVVESDPLRDFVLPPFNPPRTRTLTESEVRRVYKAAGSMGYPSGSFIQLLVLTACRRDEIRGLRWDEIVDDEAGGFMIDLPASRVKTGRKTGGHATHLSAPALAVVQACPRHQGCPFVLTNDGRVALGDVVRLKAKLDRLVAGDGGPPIVRWRLHDLRRSVVSGLAKRGHAPFVCDLLLGHKPGGLSDVAMIYQQYQFGDERRDALDHWASLVTEPAPGPKPVASLAEARAARRGRLAR